MCGIYGLSLKPKGNKALAIANFKILGLYNIERGRDSCGVCIDGKIKKSILEFDDFIRDNSLGNTFKGTVLLGHNRAGSAGYKKTIEEAHPFLINDNLIFTHNGTIKNTADLCKKYSVEEKDFNVDSKLLGTLLYTEGDEVLQHYKGFAALAYTKLDDPHVLYLYHGTSKNYKNGALVEERPLYFLETKDAIYYSSIENSLKAIRNSEEEKVENLNYNRIFKISHGEFLLDDVIEINREEANVEVYSQTTTRNNYNGYYHHNFGNYAYGFGNNRSTIPTRSKNINTNSIPSVVMDKKKAYRESFPLRFIESASTNFKLYGSDFMFYRSGRYWFPPDLNNDDPRLVTGSFLVKKGGVITKDNWDKGSELLYFYRGVLLKDLDAYRIVKNLSEVSIMQENWVNTPKKFNFGCEISKFSVYPVCTLPEEFNDSVSEYFRYAWYKEDVRKNNHSFTPKFSGRSYIIKDQVLLEIKSSHSSKETCYYSSMSEVEDQLQRLKRAAQGGSVLDAIPFQEEEDLGKPFWPFDITFETTGDLLKFLGENEIAALKEFIIFTYKRDFSLSPTKLDVDNTLDNITNSAIKQGLSINDFIDKDMQDDSKVLYRIYKNIEDNKTETKMENTTDTQIVPETFKENVITTDKEEENQEANERIFDQIESCIISLQDIQLNTFNLQTEEDSDLAQDVVKVLLVGIENILSNLSEPLAKHNSKLLLEKVEEVKKSKNIENGVL